MCIDKKVTTFILAELTEWTADQDDQSTLDSGTDLIEEGFIDSMGLLVLISFIEREFNVGVDTSEMTKENFQSIDRIKEFIEAKQTSGQTLTNMDKS
jgi:acyl carrier protein